MSAGTSFFALEERLLLAAQPVVEITGGNAPIGGQAQITLTFDNTAAPGGSNIGYAPFIDLVLPKRGVDGVPPGTVTAEPQPDDGVTFVSASYLGVPLKATKLVFDAQGNATHPFLRGPGNTPLVVNVSTFLVGVGNEAARAGPGDELVVLELPFGSFVPEQPKVTLSVTAKVSNLADLDEKLPVAARGGFAFGKDPLNNPATDPPFVGALASTTITPTVLTVSKSYDGREGETATGPNFPHSFTLRLDVVTGLQVSNVKLIDVLPDGITVIGDLTLSGAIGTVTYNATARTITAAIASLTGVPGTEASLTVPFYVQQTLAPGTPATPVLDPISGAPRTIGNDARAEADWAPIDPRDAVTRIVINPDGPEATVTAKSIATQKSQIIPPGLDLPPSSLGPGDIIRYTVDVQVSDYFRLGSVVLTDVLSDGQAFVAGSAILTATERGTLIGSASAAFNAENVTVSRNAVTGATDLTFRIAAELVARLDDGILVGGRVSPLPDAGGTTLRLVYDAQVERNYQGTIPPFNGPLNQGDRLSNSVTVSAAVLNNANAPTGGTPTDTSASSATIAVGSPTKSVYAINGITPSNPVNVTSGDEVTFRLTYALPQTSTPTLILTDFLPLPIFAAVPEVPAGWTFLDVVSSDAPAVNVVKWGPLAGTFNALGTPNPTIVINANANSIALDFGSLNPASVQNTTVDLLFTVKVKDRPFGDGLLFTNVLQARETNTPGDATVGLGLTQVVLNEPNLKLYKGVVAKENTSLGQFTQAVGPTGVAFQAPGAANAFTGTISSSGLAANPVSSDIVNLDARDTVTFVMVVENTGNGPRGAFDVTVKDVLPTGFVVPTGGLNLRVTDGTGTALSHTRLTGGLFGTGIEINDTANEGGLRPFDAANGRNIAVIAYDLTVDQSVQAREVLRNAAEITRYAALNGGLPPEKWSSLK